MKIIIIIILVTLTLASCSNVKDKEGVKIETIEQEKDLPNGEFVKKYPNGYIQVRGEIYNNERVGLWVSYFESGIKQSESTYRNGILYGHTASFYPNGQIRYLGIFLNGNKEGEWKVYSEEGKLLKNNVYKNGKLESK